MNLAHILGNWDLTDTSVKQIYRSTWQIGEAYILKTGTNFEWLKSNLVLINVLKDQNVPVASILPTKDGSDYIVSDGSYYFMSVKIIGENITDIYSSNYIEMSYTLGEIIARLHIAFQKCQDQIYCYDSNFYNELEGWIADTFQDKRITSVPSNIFIECTNYLKDVYPGLPRQLIHRDFHLGNLLFQDNELTGYIDFDLCQINARVFDLCYMSLSFLIDCTDNIEKTSKWFTILRQMIKGYESLLTLTATEKEAIPIMMCAIELLFVAYFYNENNEAFAEGAVKMVLWLWNHRTEIIV